MTTSFARHIAVLVLLAHASVARAQTRAEPAMLVGCYRFSHQPYRLGSDVIIRIDTVLVRLDSTVTSPGSREEPAEYALHPSALRIGDVRATPERLAPYWSVLADSSVVLSWA